MDLKDYSITRLASILCLSRKRITKLLEDGKIYIDEYGQVCIKPW